MSTADDLADMKRAAGFGAHILRTELGPGGVTEDTPDLYQQGWAAAAAFLATITDYPMIPLHMWRRGDGCECKTSQEPQ